MLPTISTASSISQFKVLISKLYQTLHAFQNPNNELNIEVQSTESSKQNNQIYNKQQLVTNRPYQPPVNRHNTISIVYSFLLYHMSEM